MSDVSCSGSFYVESVKIRGVINQGAQQLGSPSFPFYLTQDDSYSKTFKPDITISQIQIILRTVE